MRRIGQVEAKTNGQFIESFESAEEFRKVMPRLDRLAENKNRECVYCVIPFPSSGLVMIHVFLMPEGYIFKNDRRPERKNGKS
jgi:hypothetical protein